MPETMSSKRVVTFVPAEHAEEFARSMAMHIPHLFGEYDSVCWWSLPKLEEGVEQFRPLDGEIVQKQSVRMEFSIPDNLSALKKFTATIKKNHPWKEPVILVFESAVIEHQ